MLTAYDRDVVAWANEQAALLRAGRFADLDLENLAEEIEDVGRSEKRELVSRVAVLLAHLLKWRYQPDMRSSSWERTIREQRRAIEVNLEETPSLKGALADNKWLVKVWVDAIVDALKETRLPEGTFPESNPWSMAQILEKDFWPDPPREEVQ